MVAALSNHNDVEFHIKNNAVDIIAGKSKISLPTLSIDDFPLNETNSDTFSKIECESLLKSNREDVICDGISRCKTFFKWHASL